MFQNSTATTFQYTNFVYHIFLKGLNNERKPVAWFSKRTNGEDSCLLEWSWSGLMKTIILLTTQNELLK